MSEAFDQSRFESLVAMALETALANGADQAEAAVSGMDGLSANVRLGRVESLERDRSHMMGVTVYRGGAKGSASTSDLSEKAVREATLSACSIARFTQADECAGLAEAGLMAREFPDLDLYHPWALGPDEAIARAKECEDAARAFDRRVDNSDGASLNSHEGLSVYGNSHGFLHGYPSSRHGISCAVLARDPATGDLQRDFAYSVARCADDIDAVASVGQLAAERSVKRLNPQKISTRNAPVLMTPDMARSFIGHFVGAVRGGALYRRASFLEGRLGEAVFPSFIQLRERPHLPRAMGSTAYDAEGVATAERALVADGVLKDYLLDSYSARKLGMQTTGNAGGVHNLELTPGTDDFQSMLQRLGTGFLVTEMMGSGVNGVTGDYSRGASGFWVEGGVIQYPVAEVTVAGQLRDLFLGIVAVGSDLDTRSGLRTPSILLESAAIAGS